MALKMCVMSMFLLACIVSQTLAYTYIKEAKVWKDRCVDELGNQYNVGQHWFNNKVCERRECVMFNEKLHEAGAGCGIVIAPPGCVFVPSKGRYPDCCGELQCSEMESDIH